MPGWVRKFLAFIDRHTTVPISSVRRLRKWFSRATYLTIAGYVWAAFEAPLPKRVEHLRYVALYVLCCLTLVWALGMWMTSKFLEDRNPTAGNRAHRRRFRFIGWSSFTFWKWSGFISIGVLASAGFWTVGWLQAEYESEKIEEQRVRLEEELNRLEGWLFPANEPIPQTTCGGLVKEDSLMVFMGSVVAVPRTLPATVLLVNGRKLLVLDKAEDGALAISLEIRSPDGKIITQIERGHFTINPNNILRRERKDRSTLKIVDQHGRVILHMRYFNRQAMWIDAVLQGATLRGSEHRGEIMCSSTDKDEPLFTANFTNKEMYTKSYLYWGDDPKPDLNVR